jgi:hypothetical protein
MDKMEIIRAHVATIGYEDSNVFALVKWAQQCGQQGYTETVEGEFELFLLKPEDKARLDELEGSVQTHTFDYEHVYFSQYDDAVRDQYEDMEDIKESRALVVPISSFDELEGDIEITKV